MGIGEINEYPSVTDVREAERKVLRRALSRNGAMHEIDLAREVGLSPLAWGARKALRWKLRRAGARCVRRLTAHLWVWMI